MSRKRGHSTAANAGISDLQWAARYAGDMSMSDMMIAASQAAGALPQSISAAGLVFDEKKEDDKEDNESESESSRDSSSDSESESEAGDRMTSALHPTTSVMEEGKSTLRGGRCCDAFAATAGDSLNEEEIDLDDDDDAGSMSAPRTKHEVPETIEGLAQAARKALLSLPTAVPEEEGELLGPIGTILSVMQSAPANISTSTSKKNNSKSSKKRQARADGAAAKVVGSDGSEKSKERGSDTSEEAVEKEDTSEKQREKDKSGGGDKRDEVEEEDGGEEEYAAEQDHPCAVVTVVVCGNPGSDALADGSLLCLGDRCVLGSVGEVFGPVDQPHYVVHALVKAASMDSKRNNVGAEEEYAAHQEGINDVREDDAVDAAAHAYADTAAVGKAAPPPKLAADPTVFPPLVLSSDRLATLFPGGGMVYTVQRNARFVTLSTVLSQSRRTKCDASNEHDEELPLEQREFSDDEEERSVRSSVKRNKRKAGTADTAGRARALEAGVFVFGEDCPPSKPDVLGDSNDGQHGVSTAERRHGKGRGGVGCGGSSYGGSKRAGTLQASVLLPHTAPPYGSQQMYQQHQRDCYQSLPHPPPPPPTPLLPTAAPPLQQQQQHAPQYLQQPPVPYWQQQYHHNHHHHPQQLCPQHAQPYYVQQQQQQPSHGQAAYPTYSSGGVSQAPPPHQIPLPAYPGAGIYEGLGAAPPAAMSRTDAYYVPPRASFSVMPPGLDATDPANSNRETRKKPVPSPFFSLPS